MKGERGFSRVFYWGALKRTEEKARKEGGLTGNRKKGRRGNVKTQEEEKGPLWDNFKKRKGQNPRVKPKKNSKHRTYQRQDKKEC